MAHHAQRQVGGGKSEPVHDQVETRRVFALLEVSSFVLFDNRDLTLVASSELDDELPIFRRLLLTLCTAL